MLITVASGKGGVGKTTVAVNLAVALAGLGRRAVVVDADFGVANADVLLGLTPRNRLHPEVLREMGADADEAGVWTRAATASEHGVTLVAGIAGVAGAADVSARARDRVLRGVNRLRRGADFVILDAPAGVGESVLEYVTSADLALLVTTPEPTALADVYALIKCLHAGKRLNALSARVVVNEARDGADAAMALTRLQAVAERFLGVRVLGAGWVPRDEAACRAVRARRPLVRMAPGSAGSMAIRSMAKWIEKEQCVRIAGLSPPSSGVVRSVFAALFPRFRSSCVREPLIGSQLAEEADATGR
ncbi:MAG: P-loop NTPase [Phycisphaerae bacterium]|nr:P-loop NTPase [Phycisphaerae bacterium]